MNGAARPAAPVSLTWLLDGIAPIAPTPATISDLTLDSREARPGSLFLALRGRGSHGLAHAADAVGRGAGAVLWEPDGHSVPPALPASVYVAPVADLSRLAGRIADRYFQWPSSALTVFGITGTNGKTTCAYLLTQCLNRLGMAAGYVGTLGWGRIGALEPLAHTTPDVVTVHRMLAALRASGVGDVAMEVSSHALDQDRVAGVRFAGAAFTNLSRDHLDYHGSMQEYGEAKARLFEFPGLRQIIINVGDPHGRAMAQRLAGSAPLIAVWVGAGESGWLAGRTLRAAAVETLPRGLAVTLDGTFGGATLRTRLLGRFNAENCLVVLACLAGRGVPLAQAVDALGGCAPPPGRMQLVEPKDDRRALAVIDYAHTPDALAQALAALREHCPGRLWCVFGCGGDRDAGKRPLMGAAADEIADRIIVTDDNPRSEDPGRIVRDIVGGIAPGRARVIHDRAQAIRAALEEAVAGDVVLIAGKGHEDYQIYGAERRAFSDLHEVERLLGEAA